MDEQSLQHYLNEIAQEEIPDDMNLLSEIKTQLQKQSAPAIRPMMILARVATVLLVFGLMGASGYALFYQFLYTDPSIPEQELTLIGESQTVEDVTVTLDWVYADVHRAAVLFTTEYNVDTPFVGEFTADVTLQTTDGIFIPQSFDGGGGGGSDTPSDTRRVSSSFNFDTAMLSDISTELDLILTIRFPVPAGGSGGSGGSGGQVVPTPSFALEDIPERVYIFAFSVPVLLAREIEPIENPVTMNGVTMTLRNVRYTPSLVKFDLCYTSPDSRDWAVNVMVHEGDTNFRNASFSNSEVTSDLPLGDEQCLEMFSTVALSDSINTFTVEIPYIFQPLNLAGLSSDSPEITEVHAYFLDNYGIDIQIDIWPGGGYGYGIRDYPADMTPEEAQAIFNGSLFSDIIEGSWTFTLPLD